MKRLKHLASVKAMTTLLLANKKNIRLLAFFFFFLPKRDYVWRIMNYKLSCYKDMALTKAMKILPI